MRHTLTLYIHLLGTTSSQQPPYTSHATSTPTSAPFSNTAASSAQPSPSPPTTSSASPYPQNSTGSQASTVSCASRASASRAQCRVTRSLFARLLLQHVLPSWCFTLGRMEALRRSYVRARWNVRVLRWVCWSMGRMGVLRWISSRMRIVCCLLLGGRGRAGVCRLLSGMSCSIRRVAMRTAMRRRERRCMLRRGAWLDQCRCALCWRRGIRLIGSGFSVRWMSCWRSVVGLRRD